MCFPSDFESWLMKTLVFPFIQKTQKEPLTWESKDGESEHPFCVTDWLYIYISKNFSTPLAYKNKSVWSIISLVSLPSEITVYYPQGILAWTKNVFYKSPGE